MANEIVNKSGVQPVPCDRYVITSSMVLKYLQDQLGFSVGSDFTRWVGVTPEQSYVRMRVVINPKDIMADSNSKDYVDRILESKGAGIQFKDTVINTLKPYTFFGDRYEEISRFAKLSYSSQANLFRIYLRPERIIYDMLSDPATDKVDGTMSILAVQGTSSDTIRWEVAVERKGNNFAAKTDLSMDQIFYRQ